MRLAGSSAGFVLALVAACGGTGPVPARVPVESPLAEVVRAASLPEVSPLAEAAPVSVEPAPSVLAAPAPVPSEVASPSPAPAFAVVAAPADDLAAEVAELFARHCHECHGSKKRPKGGLRLTELAAVLARPAEEALVVAGDAERSPLYARLVLPEDDEDRMPPEGPPLAPEELALVRRWIEAGAPPPPASATDSAPRPEELVAPLAPAVRVARDRALALLVARGAHARLLSATSEAVEVDLSVALPPAGAAELAALAGLEPCLVELSLVRLSLADGDLAALGAFGELRRLRLGETPLGDAALLHLAPLAKLEALDLHDTRVTDAAVPALARLGSLRRLYLGGTALTPVALDALAAALPACVLVR